MTGHQCCREQPARSFRRKD
ncbi:MAG: hypothetical protein ACRD9S_16675 [Pyrinomonadaceae bacterium]